MRTLLRGALLCVFAAAGVGLAISLVVHTDPGGGREGTPLRGLLDGVAKVTQPPAMRNTGASHTGAFDAGGRSLLPEVEPQAASLYGPVARQMEYFTQTLRRVEKANEQSQIERLERTLERVEEAAERNARLLTDSQARAASQFAPPGTEGDDAGAAESLPTPAQPQIKQAAGDGQLIINVKNSDIREVLDYLSEQTKLNILAAPSVQGTVTASLSNVSVEEAVDAILQLTGFTSRREGDFLYVGTPADLKTMDQMRDRVATRVYRPNYVTAADLQVLITPLLTQSIGTVTVSTAAERDIPSDNVTTGGDSFAQNEVLLVRDYERVLAQIDTVVADVDTPPRQVMIEAMIVSVALNDSTKMGINLESLRDKNHLRIISGNGSPMLTLSSLNVTEGGLHVGFLDSTLSAFVEALDSVGDTEVIASPRLLCVNKQRAEILIGDQKGYLTTTATSTATTQSVQFLDVGTQLRIRPFISSDGMIRMEIHPELSKGDVRLVGTFALPEKSVTQVTSNVMCHDGATVVVGGLIRDDISRTINQIPIVGNLPLVGPLFRRKNDSVQREEIIVVITPHIIHNPLAHHDGKPPLADVRQREAHVFVDRMTPVARKYYGNRYLRLAKSSWLAGNGNAALSYVDLALQFTPRRFEAISLRDEILSHPLSGAGAVESMMFEEVRPPEDDPASDHVVPPTSDPVAPPPSSADEKPSTPAAPTNAAENRSAAYRFPLRRPPAESRSATSARRPPPDVRAPGTSRPTDVLRNIGPPPMATGLP